MENEKSDGGSKRKIRKMNKENRPKVSKWLKTFARDKSRLAELKEGLDRAPSHTSVYAAIGALAGEELGFGHHVAGSSIEDIADTLHLKMDIPPKSNARVDAAKSKGAKPEGGALGKLEQKVKYQAELIRGLKEHKVESIKAIAGMQRQLEELSHLGELVEVLRYPQGPVELEYYSALLEQGVTCVVGGQDESEDLPRSGRPIEEDLLWLGRYFPNPLVETVVDRCFVVIGGNDDPREIWQGTGKDIRSPYVKIYERPGGAPAGG